MTISLTDPFLSRDSGTDSANGSGDWLGILSILNGMKVKCHMWVTTVQCKSDQSEYS
jgi:hypothetical protein